MSRRGAGRPGGEDEERRSTTPAPRACARGARRALALLVVLAGLLLGGALPAGALPGAIVIPVGAAPDQGSLAGVDVNEPANGVASSATGEGYWLVAADGGIFAFGDAPFLGSAAASGATVVAMA